MSKRRAKTWIFVYFNDLNRMDSWDDKDKGSNVNIMTHISNDLSISLEKCHAI